MPNVFASYRFTFISLLLLTAGVAASPGSFPQGAPAGSGENGFSVSPTLFTTLAAINTAGYNAGIDSPINEHYKVRTQIRQELAKRKIPSLPELTAFYKQHKKPTDTGDLSQYISFALVANGPPNFEVPAQVPPDVQALAGLSELLARFYKEANLEDLWTRAQPAYAAAMSEYQEPVIGTLFETNGYLRNPSGYLGRKFQIYLDLLAAPDQIQVRSYRDDYFLVISPTTAPVVDEIRDAYLAYLLDPLTFKYSEIIKSKKALEKYAEGAPALDLAYKDDWSLLVTKCVVKALDSRLMHGGPEKRQAFVNQAMREGYILTAGLAELLPNYEKQQDAFRLYYPELISALDVKKEEKRLKNVEFVQSVPPRVIAPPARMQLDPAEESLQSAEGLFGQKDYENARKLYKKALEQTSDKAKQGRAYFGLGLIDLGEKHWDEALNLFGRTVDMNPDPATTAWSHYYLGQLALKAGDFEKATAEFKQTLAIEGASARAREAAEKALQSNSGEQKQ
ncbi:MAG: tetratricopeptide repeat protein [Acidobacteriaceae bacterium]|nr:tetratricopeptide repeat protein [Acidobacteriaceae bacterium]MBV9034174.1 tetratricopeptide repeat protein [Acidobacteriaceae bacterium]